MTFGGGLRELRLAVVDDQPLYRQMLASLLRAVPGVRSVVEASSAAEARERLRPAELDVAVIDIELGDGDGIELGRELRAGDPELAVVLLSAVDSMHRFLRLSRDEVRGWSYLSKSSSLSSPALMTAIRATLDGRTVLDPALVAARTARRSSPVDALSRRQYEVLGALASGLTNAAIAERLGIAVRSVDNHVNALYGALSLRSDGSRNPRVEATLLFLEHTR
ncbi:LuxR family two component transcriptional regulator [Rathayibacter sp. PhB93]|uniref:response regulator transcription factor n=1 Tax=unclassified Rathayibacter TaxID=2609250 RepID=UPI000F9339B7|nr:MULTISPECIES: response regulator transcription factor [unclassified Rathayibacter]ROQ15410.1 LuxR family two component transcriptional regulator [Rathayibacter sp. PhB93]TDQ15348.1 LuxR family two component transcriptional regulator [Rathayibacter sp. PhB1]